MPLYNAAPAEVEQMIKSVGTGYPSIDRPWQAYYSKEALTSPLPETSLYNYLKDRNSHNLDSYALNYYGKKITFRELFQRIDMAARAFTAQGVKTGDVVSVVALASVPCVVTMYALNKIGAVVDFINVMSTAKDMVKFFRSSGSKVIVSADVFINKVLLASRAIGVQHIITFSMGDDLPLMKKMGNSFKTREAVDESYLLDPLVLTWEKFLASGASAEDVTVSKDPAAPALLAHTGGTTGTPKGVLLNDNALNAVAFQYQYLFDTKPNEVFLDLVVPFVVYGSLINLHMPLTLRTTVALIPEFNPNDWPEYFNKYRPNFITAIPNYFISMLKNPRMRNVNLEYVKILAVGGEAASNALETGINKFLKEHRSRARLSKGYGMTEMSASACTCWNGINAPGSVGVPLPRNLLMIYDNDKQQECRYNEVGEVCFQGPGRMLAYRDQPEEMESILQTHEDGSVWLHTGDLGYMNRRGFLHIVGRLKRVILTTYKGVAYRVYPNVIEDVLTEHPMVREACVIRLKDDPQGRTKVYVALHDHNRVNEEEFERELRSYCRTELSEYMQPALYEFRATLPKTPMGKVDYRLLESLTSGSVSAHAMLNDR